MLRNDLGEDQSRPPSIRMQRNTQGSMANFLSQVIVSLDPIYSRPNLSMSLIDHLLKLPNRPWDQTCSMCLSSVQFSSVTQSCLTLCDPMNRSTPGLPLHHHLLEFTQTHVHRVGDAIQPSHPLSSPFPPAPNPSQQQSQLFA